MWSDSVEFEMDGFTVRLRRRGTDTPFSRLVQSFVESYLRLGAIYQRQA